MPILTSSDYKPNILLRNGHINTFFPYFFRKKPNLPFERQRIYTPDEDFFDVDWLKPQNTSKLVVLLHGLEGSSASQYINGASRMFASNGFHVAAIIFRSCSGEMNRLPEMYHSGYTKDLNHFLSSQIESYEKVYICGFSLGGNVTFKYAGDQIHTISPKVKAIAGISVPCDLRAGSIKLMEKQNHFYENRFLQTLLGKVRQKHHLHPANIDVSQISKVKTLWDFDDYFTSSLHGFKDAEDYYRQCSSKQFLNNINIPALLINAKDDTFLAKESYPYEDASNNENLFFLAPEYGGHVGFTTFDTNYYWHETKVLDFFKCHSIFS